ncbi:MAG TPA: HNH endonuclease signature motif containing protein, partial [Candidatus Dormibacteraeota bacterium]
DEDSLVIDVGRERRLFRGGARVALEHRDGGCVWPGCTRPARLCHADHLEPWWAGGKSTTANGRLLCLYHHRLHSEGWELSAVRDPESGITTWVPRPPGWALEREYPGAPPP